MVVIVSSERTYVRYIILGAPIRGAYDNFPEFFRMGTFNPLANQLRCVDFLTPSTPLIIPHRLPAFLESLMPLKN